MNIPKSICENERFDQFDQENSSNEAFKSIEHTDDQTVLGDEECQGCFVKPELIALYGDKDFLDRKSLRQILKTEEICQIKRSFSLIAPFIFPRFPNLVISFSYFEKSHELGNS